MPPRVTVVMPAYNAAATVGEAVAAVLAQDWDNLEVVVVNDGSRDDTGAILDAMTDGRLRVLHRDNAGAGAARDAGIGVATGDFVLLADADDTCDPGLVRALVAGIGGCDLAFARCRYLDAGGAVVAVQDVQPRHPGPLDLLRGIMVNTPLVRRSAILAIGGHDHGLDGSIDLDLFVRLAMAREKALVALPGVLSGYRRGAGQITSDWRRMQRTWSRVRDKAVAAGLAISPRAGSEMRGRHCVYWATLAYMAGDHGAARRLMAEAAWRVPGYVLRDELARVRGLACLATLLPRGLHDRVQARFNARRRAG